MIALDHVSYTYPHSTDAALCDITLRVPAGRALLCTGRSGCGKSTLLRLINGLAPHCLHGTVQGQIRVAGLDVARTSPAAIAAQAGTLFQDPERQFFALTVDDEIALALQWRNWPPEQVRQAVAESMERLAIAELAGRSLFGLSEGQKQKVALAGLLAGKPKVLLLDEPSANLDPESTRELGHILCSLKAQGVTLLIVDHRLWWLRDVADDVLVLDAGRCVAQGDFSLLNDAALRAQHGLRTHDLGDLPPALPEQTAAADAVLTCRNLHFGYTRGRPLFSGADYAFAAGEVVALAGRNGVGKTTLARLLTGLEKPSSGSVHVRGVAMPPRRLPHHVQLVLQNAGHQLRMNSVEAELLDAAALPGTSPETVRDRVASTLAAFGLAPLRARHPQSLSGGEQQRLAVACAAVRRPAVLILDEPTSGLDGENMRRMAHSVRTVAGYGAAVLVITHDPEFIREACTRQLWLHASETTNAHHGGAA